MTDKKIVKPYDQLRLTRTEGGWKVELYGKDAEGNMGISGRLIDRADTFDGAIQVAKARYDVV